MNAEQKQRMAHELGQWNAAMKSSCSVSDLLAISTRMAALLQDLIDAPEPEQPNQSEQHLEMVNTPAPSVPDGWQPIETAPKDNKRSLFLARFNDDGTMQAFDYDGTWQSERESWELPQVYYYWATALGNVEEPTHWMYEPEWFSKLNSAQQPAPSVPGGRKMVPDEPTAEMLEAGHRAAWQSVPSLFDRDDVANVYRAMLAAAPAARLEDQPPPADRAIQPGASDATQSLYTIISDPRGAAGIYETIEDARPHAEITARRSTFGRAAIVTIVAEVAMVPQWEG